MTNNEVSVPAANCDREAVCGTEMNSTMDNMGDDGVMDQMDQMGQMGESTMGRIKHRKHTTYFNAVLTEIGPEEPDPSFHAAVTFLQVFASTRSQWLAEQALLFCRFGLMPAETLLIRHNTSRLSKTSRPIWLTLRFNMINTEPSFLHTLLATPQKNHA